MVHLTLAPLALLLSLSLTAVSASPMPYTTTEIKEIESLRARGVNEADIFHTLSPRHDLPSLRSLPSSALEHRNANYDVQLSALAARKEGWVAMAGKGLGLLDRRRGEEKAEEERKLVVRGRVRGMPIVKRI